MKRYDLRKKIKLNISILLLLILTGCSNGHAAGAPVEEGTVPVQETELSADVPDAEIEIPEAEPEPVISEEEKALDWIKDHHIYPQAEYVDISHVDVTDLNIDAIIGALPNLNRLVMIDCGLDNDGYASLQDRHPDVKIVWEIVLDHWTIRTDSVAFSTFKTTAEEFYMNNDDAYYLKYCNELVALDLGHNYVSDLSFLEYMPELKVLILVDNVKEKQGETLRHLTDLSEVQYCTKLRYLEIFANNVSDFSFMENLTELEDLNISYNSVSSIQYMTNMPNLKKLWMEHTYISYDGYLKLRQLYPNARIVCDGEGSVDQGWRSGARYVAIRRMFRENIIDDLYRD